MDRTGWQNLEDASTLQFLGGIKEDFERDYPDETEAQIQHRFKKYMIEIMELRFNQICDLQPHIITPEMLDNTVPYDDFPENPNLVLHRGDFSMAVSSVQILWEQITCLIRVKPASYPPMHQKLKDWQGKIFDAYRHAIGLPYVGDSVDYKLLFRYLHRDAPAIREDFRPFKEAWLAEEPVQETEVNEQAQVREGDSA